MKKIFLFLFMIIFVSNAVYAGNLPSSKMKKITKKMSVYYNQTENNWLYTKKKNIENKYETDCDYNFLYKGRLIGYSNSDMKFYEFINSDADIDKKELSEEEIKELFPLYKFIKISDFCDTTNSIKIKKHFRKLRLAIMNDSEYKFDDYKFTSGNTNYKTYSMTGFIDVKKKGMIQFSCYGENAKNSPWYVILVR